MEFAAEAQNMAVGEVSQVITTGRGFHLLQLTDARGGDVGATESRRLRLSHLFLPPDALETADDLYRRLREGADFAELTRQHSIDDKSADKGGDLGWFFPAELPDYFEVANTLQEGETAPPLKSPFGVHLLRLEKLEVINMRDLRERARRVLRPSGGRWRSAPTGCRSCAAKPTLSSLTRPTAACWMVPLADSIKPIAITSGDPGGIGPDLCLDILNSRCPSPLTVLGDKAVLKKRADMLGAKFNAADYSPAQCVRRAVLHSPAQCKKNRRVVARQRRACALAVAAGGGGMLKRRVFGDAHRAGFQANDLRGRLCVSRPNRLSRRPRRRAVSGDAAGRKNNARCRANPPSAFVAGGGGD